MERERNQPTFTMSCVLLCYYEIGIKAHRFQIGKLSLQLQNEIIVKNQSCTNTSFYMMLQGVIQLSGLTKNWSRRT
jgi:hypothetical protein